MENNQIRSKVKQGYFFLDYLRLHAYGKEKGIFKKNRNMMESQNAEDPKRGYTSYIQRIFRTLLDDLFPYLEIVKPRDVFGYNVGPKNNDLYSSRPPSSEFRALDIMTNKFHGILYVFRRNMIYGEFKDYVERLITTIDNSSYLNHRDRMGFFKIRLNTERSGGWKALKDCKEIAQVYENMIDAIEPEELAKNTISNIIDKVGVLSEGQTVYKKKHNSHEAQVEREFFVLREEATRDSLGYISNVNYRICPVTDTDDVHSVSRSSLFPKYSSENEAIKKQLEKTNALLSNFKDHWVHIYENSQGFSLDSVFNVAKSSFLRMLESESDKETIMNIDINGSDRSFFHETVNQIVNINFDEEIYEDYNDDLDLEDLDMEDYDEDEF